MISRRGKLLPKSRKLLAPTLSGFEAQRMDKQENEEAGEEGKNQRHNRPVRFFKDERLIVISPHGCGENQNHPRPQTRPVTGDRAYGLVVSQLVTEDRLEGHARCLPCRTEHASRFHRFFLAWPRSRSAQVPFLPALRPGVDES